MLRIAGRHTGIVSFLANAVASGTVEDDPGARRDEHVARQVGWVRKGVGDRLDDVELSSVLTLTVTVDRGGEIDRLIEARRWSGVTRADIDRIPAIAIGLSDAVIPSVDLETIAPVLALFAGGTRPRRSGGVRRTEYQARVDVRRRVNGLP